MAFDASFWFISPLAVLQGFRYERASLPFPPFFLVVPLLFCKVYLWADVRLPLANEDLAVELLHWLPYHFVRLVVEGVPTWLPLPSWEHSSLACRSLALIVFWWAPLRIRKVCCLNKVIHVLLRHVRLHVCVRVSEKGKKRNENVMMPFKKRKEKWAFALICYTHTSCLPQECARW